MSLPFGWRCVLGRLRGMNRRKVCGLTSCMFYLGVVACVGGVVWFFELLNGYRTMDTRLNL